MTSFRFYSILYLVLDLELTTIYCGVSSGLSKKWGVGL